MFFAKKIAGLSRWYNLSTLRNVLMLVMLGTATSAASESLLDFFNSKKQDKYADLKLDMTQDEVIYVRGFPQAVIISSNDISLKTDRWFGNQVYSLDKIPKEKSMYDYLEWQFYYTRYRIDVSFDSKKRTVKSVKCYSEKNNNHDCPSLSGIYDGDSEDQLLSRLGKPSSEQIVVPTKIIEFEKLGYRFYLNQLKVYMLEIYK